MIPEDNGHALPDMLYEVFWIFEDASERRVCLDFLQFFMPFHRSACSDVTLHQPAMQLECFTISNECGHFIVPYPIDAS